MRSPVRAAASAVLATLLAACATHHTSTTSASQGIGRVSGALSGTIVAMRPLAAQARNAGGASFLGASAVRTTILGAIGGGVAGGAAASQIDDGRAVEFIIRQDDGETVSIVQANEDNFRLGERVAIARGARARLARGAPPPLPGS
jgi:outer membrane lipoprotein SlyB